MKMNMMETLIGSFPWQDLTITTMETLISFQIDMFDNLLFHLLCIPSRAPVLAKAQQEPHFPWITSIIIKIMWKNNIDIAISIQHSTLTTTSTSTSTSTLASSSTSSWCPLWGYTWSLTAVTAPASLQSTWSGKLICTELKYVRNNATRCIKLSHLQQHLRSDVVQWN